MKLLELLAQRSQQRMVRKYGKACARAMQTSALAVKEYYKAVAPTNAWVARKTLGRRRNWKQLSGTVFVYELGPNRDGCLEKCNEYEPWLSGTLDITDDKSLWDVIQGVIRTELYWNYLSGLEIPKCLELTDLALAQAAKIVGAKNLPQAVESESRTGA